MEPRRLHRVRDDLRRGPIQGDATLALRPRWPDHRGVPARRTRRNRE